MTTPNQWNGQQGHEPRQNSPQQGASSYGTPPTGQPAAYNGYGQAAPASQGYGQGQGQEQGYAQNPYAGGYAASDGNAGPAQQIQPPQQPTGYQPPTANGYEQPGAYPQARPSAPRQLLTFPTLREELSFSTNRFGMISLASALGGWILATLLSFIMSIVARSGSFEVYGVLNPVQTILQILAAAAAVVFGVLALRASGWRNMPAAVGAVLGVVMLVPAIFYFFLGLIPYSY